MTRRLAILTAACTYTLLLAGGFVHSTGASLACPDWPLCFGNFFPPMIGNIRFEHGHRLIAATVGILTLITAVLVWKKERPALRPLAIAAVSTVGIQIVLGGITVIFLLPDLVSTAHLAVGSAFFGMLIALSIKISGRAPGEIPARLRGFILAAAAATYAQMVLGAFVRHTESGLACLDVPRCHGEWFLPISTPQGLHMLHRIVSPAVLALTASVLWLSRGQARVRGWALAAFLLATAQILAGIFSVLTNLSLGSVMSHLAIAEALWGVWVVLSVSTTASPAPRVVQSAAGPELSQA